MTRPPSRRRLLTGPPYEPAGVFHDTASVTTSSVVIQWKEPGNNGYEILSYVVEAFNEWEGFWRIVMTSKRVGLLAYRHDKCV